MKVTISDIARQAGVSKATVSRVLNNRTEGVGPETRQRIQELLRETGFQPSGFARGLATGKSASVGVIIPDIANPYYSMLVRGAEDTLKKAGYSLFLCNSDLDIKKEKEYVSILIEKGVDGVILDSAESDCDCQLELLEEAEIPYILIDRIIDDPMKYAGVYVDNLDGGRQAAEFLLSRPGSSLIFINGPAELSQSRLRQEGVELAIKQMGLPADRVEILYGDYSIESGRKLMEDCLRRHVLPGGAVSFTGVFAANDLMAFGALRALREAHISVPDQVEVIGFDDIEMAEMVDPPLSTVSQPAIEMGSRSAAMLLQMITGKRPRPKTVTLATRLILRGTTRTPG
ncbi:LacI family transcriptional regulator [Leptolinea sp. HRD-7]|nr:LacI family transcriptional regulator [Leptolinea sp. HRD-7]